MGILETASGASVWRGYEYYNQNRVTNLNKVNDHVYTAIVRGSGNSKYNVSIDLEHPKKSTCDCPNASGRRVICRHKVAVYFDAFPQKAQNFYNEVIAAEEEAKRQQEEDEKRLEEYIAGLNRDQLVNIVFELLYDGPEWQFDRFIFNHLNR